MLYNRTIYDLAGVVKLVVDKVGPADRCQVLMILRGIVSYVEKFDTSLDIVYDDPLITLRNLIHTVEDVGAAKDPLPTAHDTQKGKSYAKRALKVEVNHTSSPYKQPVTLFSGPSKSKALSASKVCSEVALKSHPEPQSDSDHDTGGDLEYFNPEDDSIPSAQEVVVEESVWQPLDMLERALTAAITTDQACLIEGQAASTESNIQVSRKKRKTGDSQWSKPYLHENVPFVNPAPRLYSSKYGGRKWPENQPFVCAYCRQIQKSIKVYKEHLKVKHKEESPLNCRFCRVFYGNAELFGFHSCSKGHVCKICKKSFPRPSKLQRHLETHNKSTICRAWCEICQNQYSTVQDCAIHVYQDHENVIHCDTCLEEFDPSEHTLVDPSRLFCNSCANKTDTRDMLPLASGINPNRDILVKSVKARFYTRNPGDTRPAGVADSGKKQPRFCEVCQEVVLDMYNHIRTDKHKVAEARSQGKQIVKYQCTHQNCSKVFLSEEKRSVHIEKAHSGKERHVCEKCGKAFANKASYKQHLQKHFDHDRWGCPVCGKGFTTKGYLEDHKKSVHRDKYGTTLKCAHCDMEFYDRRVRTKHIAIYHKNYIYRCNECDYETREGNAVKQHYMKKHPHVKYGVPSDYRHVADGPPPLPISRASLNISDLNVSATEARRESSSVLSYKMQVLHDDVDFPKNCKACEIMINTVEEMRVHLSTSIVHAENVKRKGYFSKTNPCGYCEKELATGAELDTHTWSEHIVDGKILFTCSNCNHGFNTMSRFRYHFDGSVCRAKGGDCKECGAVFDNRSKLQKHLAEVHKIKDAYKCSVCSKGFLTAKARQTHIAIKHSFYVFFCKYCTYQTRDGSLLEGHTLEKHGLALEGPLNGYKKRAEAASQGYKSSKDNKVDSEDDQLPYGEEIVLSDDDASTSKAAAMETTSAVTSLLKNSGHTKSVSESATEEEGPDRAVSLQLPTSSKSGQNLGSTEPAAKKLCVSMMSGKELVKRPQRNILKPKKMDL